MKAAILVSLLAGVAFAQTPPVVELVWHLPPAGVAVGDVFSCEVRAALQPGERLELDTAALWPVVLEAIAVDGAPLRYRARAFAAGELVFANVAVQVHGSAGSVAATCTPPPLTVRSILADPASALEWPGDVRGAPRSAISWWWLVVPLVATILSVRWWRRSRPVTDVAPRTTPTLFERTAARLAAIALPADVASVARFAEELSSVVRDHASERFATRATTRTTAELAALVGAPATAPLRRCLEPCDLVKFACHVPDVAACAAARDAALEFARATTSSGGR